jgi:hypothetical protein
VRQVEHRGAGDRQRIDAGMVQKFWSSADTKACFTTSGIAEYGTKMRRSVASSAIRRPSEANTRVITGGW